MDFVPTRAHALESLTKFAPFAGRDYGQKRNYDYGPGAHKYVSCLSPYLRLRLVTEEDVIRTVLAHHSPGDAEKYVQEVFWRTYFKGWLEQRPDVWSSYIEDVDRLSNERQSGGLNVGLEKATNHKTGIDCFDAWGRELVTTGYLHNHARMWFASIWIFTLKLPWQLGANFFLTHLLDGDPASNTLSWRWVGGLHTKGKHYLARASNINKYTDGRFNPGYHLANSETPPLEEDDVFDRIVLEPGETLATGAACGLLLTMEDCNPETLNDLPDIKAIGMLDLVGESAQIVLSEPVTTFRRSALDDLAHRASSHFGKPVHRFDANAQPSANHLLTWAMDHHLDTIIVPYAPAGPVQDYLRGLKPTLQREGINLVERKRTFDQLSWPHATKGFFGMKKKIPGLIEDLALA